MANKKKPEEDAANMQQNNQNVSQMQQTQDAINQLHQVKALEDQTKSMRQDSINKAHDTEFYQMQNTENLQVIGTDEIGKAYQTLLKYKTEKASLEKKIAENEEFWKMNHWDALLKDSKDDGRV